MKQAVSPDLLLCADDSCLIFQHKHVTDIEERLNIEQLYFFSAIS